MSQTLDSEACCVGCRCHPVYFWGGGKAGSNTLATYLEHDFNGKSWDPDGFFVDAQKEICWGEEVC